MELDEAVDGLGAAVGGAAGVEVGQERLAPLLQGAPEASDLGDGAGRERDKDLLGDPPTGGEVAGLVGGAELLGAAPRDLDFDVALVGVERLLQSGLLPVGEFLGAAVQDVPDAVEGVTGAAAVAVDLLLQPTPDLIHGGRAELHDVERVQDGDGVLELVVDRVLVAVERVQGRDLDAGAEALVALLQPTGVGGPGPAGDQVEQPGAGVSLAVTGKIDHPGEFLGSVAAVGDRPGRHVVPHVLIDTGRSSNGGTEAVNGLIELHRRIARGFRNRDNYRLRMLLVGGGLTSTHLK